MRRPWAGRADLPVMDQPLADGGRLLLFVRERSFREDVGRLDQVVEYALADREGRIVERSADRLTYWMADPQSAAQAAGLALDGAAVAVGEVGDIWVFRKV